MSIDEVRITTRGHYLDMELNGVRITTDTLKDAFLRNIQEEIPIPFSELIAYSVRILKKTGAGTE